MRTTTKPIDIRRMKRLSTHPAGNRLLKLFTLVICLASSHFAAAGIVSDLRDTDVVLVVEKGTPSTRWFYVRDCASFKTAPILDALGAGKAGVSDVKGEFRNSVKSCGIVSDEASIRVIGTPTAVWLFTLAGDGVDPETVELEETQRKTRLATDLQTLLKIVLKVPTKLVANDRIAVRVKPLQYKRATVLTRVKWNASQAAPHNLVTGPTEHLYLSADLPIDNVSMLKYDDTKREITTKNAPAKFYGSLNYSFGDIGLERASWSWSSLSAKLLMQISSKPLNGLGAGLGFRLPATELWGFKLNTLSLFGAVIWLREDSGTPAAVDTRYKAKLRGGLSLNLDAALGWIKG